MTNSSAKQINRWRGDTPGCGHTIHLNNAGAALMPRPVIDAVYDHLARETMMGGYEAEDHAAEAVNHAYRSVAGIVGSEPDNIAMVENATVAISQALSAFDFNENDTIITTRVDYSSNQIMLLNLARRFGVTVVRAEDLPKGGVDPNSVRELIKKHNPKLMLMSWIPTHMGLIQDAESVSEICRESDTPLVLDACQAVGQIPIDVKNLGCDFLAATSRKFLRGPRGIGFLYVSDRMLEDGIAPLFPDTHGARWVEENKFELQDGAKRFENWESPVSLKLGMGRAAEYALDTGLETIMNRSFSLADAAREKLQNIAGVSVLDRGVDRCAIVSIGLDAWQGDEIVHKLRERNVNTSAASRTASVIDMDKMQYNSILRISPHYYNTMEEIDSCVDAIDGIINK